MIQKGNFLLMHRDEFRSWLQAQKITRRIKGLQVHHTDSPNYTTRGVKNGVGTQDKFKCLEGMRDFHVKTNKWRATGQNITIFEDGYVAISLDRDLNQDPAGIYNNNKGWVCIENIGFFDKGQDQMTDEEKKSYYLGPLYRNVIKKGVFEPNLESILHTSSRERRDVCGIHIQTSAANLQRRHRNRGRLYPSFGAKSDPA